MSYLEPWQQRILAPGATINEQTKAQLRESFSKPLPRGISYDWINRSWASHIYINRKKIAIQRCKKQADAQAARLRAEDFVRKHLLGENV